MFGKRSDVGAQQKPVLPIPQTVAPSSDAFAGGAAAPSHIPDLGIAETGAQFSGQAARPGSKSIQPEAPKVPKSESSFDGSKI